MAQQPFRCKCGNIEFVIIKRMNVQGMDMPIEFGVSGGYVPTIECASCSYVYEYRPEAGGWQDRGPRQRVHQAGG